MFVFLADEERRIEVPARRDGQPGSLARGFFVWNTEVGDKTLGAAFFLFDYADAPQPRTVRASDRFRDQRHDLLPQEVAAVPPGEACHGHDGKPSQSRALTPEAPSPSAL
jgi:hypothetical protein